MGANHSAPEISPDADYRRVGAKGPNPGPISYKPKKEKNLSSEELSYLLPYLESVTNKISSHVDALNNGSHGGWQGEYAGITAGNGSPAVSSCNPSNAELNRYRNIVAYDHSRVVVTPNEHNGNNDYVNANYLPGHRLKHGYIASQGPVPDSFNAFWQMVWESGTTGIVMVTNEIEQNRLKCHRYWPSREEPRQTYGMVEVTLEAEHPHSTYIYRILTVKVGNESERIHHFQYTVWPDHGVPNTTSEILGFRKAVRKVIPQYGPPLVVHCSAGVGRTGSFVVVDTLLARAESLEKDFDVKKLVENLRLKRNYMVQTLVQYQFCHRAILDALNKSIQRTVRAVKKKGNDVLQNAEFDLAELQNDISETLDTYAGDDGGEGFLTLGRKAGKGVVADARWSAFDRESDISVATAVPKDVRQESLAASQDMWRVRGNVPMGAENLGYSSPRAPGLEPRVQSLALSASPDAWRSRYQEVAAAWVSEVYDVTAALNPLESRMMSLASQTESWKLRGQHFRDAINKENEDIKVGYEARLSSLETILNSSEDRWRARGDGMRGEAVRDEGRQENTVNNFGSFEDRLGQLQTWASTSKGRGTGEGREVENPALVRAREQKKREEEEAKRQEAIRAAEEERMAKERVARAKREEERRRKAEKPVVGARSETIDMPAKKMVELKTVEKEKEVHPMIAQAMDPIKIKKTKSKSKKK